MYRHNARGRFRLEPLARGVVAHVEQPYAFSALTSLAPIPRVRARGARRWRRELGGGVRQHPGSNNCVEAGERWSSGERCCC